MKRLIPAMAIAVASCAGLTSDPITIQPGKTEKITKPVDPTLFKQEKVYLGVTFSTPGTFPNMVTVSGDDAVEVESWATVQVKLL